MRRAIDRRVALTHLALVRILHTVQSDHDVPAVTNFVQQNGVRFMVGREGLLYPTTANSLKIMNVNQQY
jgi:hypothetical protein